jgi:hypothetical protein
MVFRVVSFPIAIKIRSFNGSVSDAMKPLRQDVEQEAPDELVGAERHGAVPRLPVAAGILVPVGHAALVVIATRGTVPAAVAAVEGAWLPLKVSFSSRCCTDRAVAGWVPIGLGFNSAPNRKP